MLLFSGASFFVDLIYNLSTWFCVLVIISVIHIVLYCVLYFIHGDNTFNSCCMQQNHVQAIID